MPKQRLSESSVEKVKGIAYIGWEQKVKTNFGPSSIDTEKSSNLLKVADVWEFKEVACEVGIQVGLSGFGSLTGNISRVRQRTSGRLTFTMGNNCCILMDTLNDNASIVFDNNRRIGWLVSTLSVIIFFLRSYISKYRYTEGNPHVGPETLIPYNTEAQYIDAIKDMETLRIRPDRTLTYGQLFVNLASRYSAACRALPKSTSKH